VGIARHKCIGQHIPNAFVTHIMLNTYITLFLSSTHFQFPLLINLIIYYHLFIVIIKDKTISPINLYDQWQRTAAIVF
jgi:hypothetical protein